MTTKKQQFFSGAKDALPVFLGYFSVAVTFGVTSVNNGLPIWAPTVISLTSFTGTGQFVGADLIAQLASVFEVFSALLFINARYVLMSISLSQKLPPDVKLWQRFIIAFGNTDENYAIAMSPDKDVTFIYFCGLIFSSYTGWVGGTLVGSFLGKVVPESLTSAMGIALFAMYLAIIIPPATKSRPVVYVIAISTVLSSIIKFVPFTSSLSGGWSVIICGVAAAVAGALLFPAEVQNENDNA